MAYPWLSRGHVRPPGQKGEKYSVSRGSATIVMLEEEGSNQGKTTVRLIRWTNLHAQKVTMNSSKTEPGKHMATVYATYELERKVGERGREGEGEGGERERGGGKKLFFHTKEGDR